MLAVQSGEVVQGAAQDASPVSGVSPTHGRSGFEKQLQRVWQGTCHGGRGRDRTVRYLCGPRCLSGAGQMNVFVKLTTWLLWASLLAIVIPAAILLAVFDAVFFPEAKQ